VSYKQITSFCKAEEEKLIEMLSITSKTLPSYSTIRRVMLGINIIDIQSIPEMLNVVTKLYIFKYSSIIKGKNVNIS
ncbi:MAG: hypothetical protein ACKPFA_31510, partial [Dolichospermum sp.]